MAGLVISGKIAAPLLSRPGTRGYRAGKYGAIVYVPKTDAITINKILRTINEASQKKWGEHPPADVRSPLKDGDKTYSPDVNLAGSYYLEAYGKYSPFIFDRHCDCTKVFDEKLNGCNCTFILTFKPYDVKGNTGITCYLKAISIQEDGPWINDAHDEELLKRFQGMYQAVREADRYNYDPQEDQIERDIAQAMALYYSGCDPELCEAEAQVEFQARRWSGNSGLPRWPGKE